MKRNTTVNLGNLILSLSDAIDLASPALLQHQLRVAFIAWEMARAAHLKRETMENLFMAALLHDIGAFSVEEKERLHNFEEEKPEDHCKRGEILLRNVPYLDETATTVRFHHRRWHEWNEPIDSLMVLKSQMLFLADYLERIINREKYILHQNKDLSNKVKSLSPRKVHPQVVEYFEILSEREEFWLDLVSPRLYSILLTEGPFKSVNIDLEGIMSITELFRNLIDFKSRFTATHSSGVAACARILAQKFGFTATESFLMEIAGNLHDLGKLVIPSYILEKQGSLTEKERAVMKSHTYYTYSTISTVRGLRKIAEWAGFHHEKLDGTGYPFHCKAYELDTGSRILAVADLFTALAEDRPYRQGMSKEKIEKIIRGMGDDNLIDSKVVDLLFENFYEVSEFVRSAQDMALEYFNTKFSF